MRRLATALSAAIVLVGSGAAYADPGGERPDRPKKEKQCDDGQDNDGDLLIDEGDSGCDSPNDNSEADEPAGGGGGAPDPGTLPLPDPGALPDPGTLPLPDPGALPDPAALIDEILAGLPDIPPPA